MARGRSERQRIENEDRGGFFVDIKFIDIFSEHFPVVRTPSDIEVEEFSPMTLDCNITNYNSFEVSHAIITNTFSFLKLIYACYCHQAHAFSYVRLQNTVIHTSGTQYYNVCDMIL